MQFSGVVGMGRGFGMKGGCPTANIPLADGSVSGIYAACVAFRGRVYGAAAYADPARGVLEAHLLDFSGDLVGETISIELKEKMRDNVRFEDNTARTTAIADDIRRVREYLGEHPCSPAS